jgi:hypothetical protein
MPDYTKTLIYKITCDADPTFLYVGSTVSWNQRKLRHKQCSANKPTKVYEQIRTLGGWDNVKMILVETYPCNNKREADAREQYWIEELKANMNTLRAHATEEQKKITRQEEGKRYREKYKDQSQSAYNKKRKVQVVCECGGHYIWNGVWRHKQTKHHKEWATLAGME